jgi:nitrate reductase gamma subunit
METALVVGVIGAALFCGAALVFLVWRTRSFGQGDTFSVSRGDTGKGILYAFGQGMMPWEKESARRHLISYTAGFLYHFGIFAALFWLILQIASLNAGGFVISALRMLTGAGLLAGLGLFLKRCLRPMMRSISCPDDYIANLLVDVFMGAAFAGMFFHRLKAPLYAVAMLLFLYIPLGKIRHCIFFFYSRILFGCFFGKRGVFPRTNDPYRQA